MFRLFIALTILVFCLKSDADAGRCDFSKYSKRPDGCLSLSDFKKATDGCKIEDDVCLSIAVDESYKEIVREEPVLFAKESAADKQKVIAILDSSAAALIKNPKIKGVKILLFDKDGRFTKELERDAQKYLINKGVGKSQFVIKVVDKVGG